MEHAMTVQVDVKMDLKERRIEFHQFRTWTRTTLRIEAIKCFPCYVKVTFIQMTPPHLPTVNNVVNINLPGLSVNLATSRTKQHTYGLFWKNNRNRCCIYLAFDGPDECARHYHWLQLCVRNLELYRREILETRRVSRFERFSVDGSIASMGGASMRFNDTGAIPDLNEILGPLPAVPDSAANWSRRISGVSGIYEEILERSGGGVPEGVSNNAAAGGSTSPPDALSSSSRNATRKLSRASVASGIYEVMRPPMMQSIHESVPPSPPPLPPRSRTFTNQETGFKRSYTNPDADTFKSRPSGVGLLSLRNLLQLRHGSRSGTNATASISISKPNSPAAIAALDEANHIAADTVMNTSTNCYSLKPFSYSTPDLTKLSPSPRHRNVEAEAQEMLTTTTPSTTPPAAVARSVIVSSAIVTPSDVSPATRQQRPASLAQSMQDLCFSPTTPLSITEHLPTTPLRGEFAGLSLAYTTPNTPVAIHVPSPTTTTASVIECASGYCAMAPIRNNSDASSPAAPSSHIATVHEESENLYMSLNSSRLRSAAGAESYNDTAVASPTLYRCTSTSSDAENQHISFVPSATKHKNQATATEYNDCAAAIRASSFKSPLRSTSTNQHNMLVHVNTTPRRFVPANGNAAAAAAVGFTTPPPSAASSASAAVQMRKLSATEPRRHAAPLSLNIDDKYPSYYPNAASFAYVNTTPRHPATVAAAAAATPLAAHSKSAHKSPKRSAWQARSQEPKCDPAISIPTVTSIKKSNISSKKKLTTTTPPTTTATPLEAQSSIDVADVAAAAGLPSGSASVKRSRLKQKIMRGTRLKSESDNVAAAAANNMKSPPSRTTEMAAKSCSTPCSSKTVAQPPQPVEAAAAASLNGDVAGDAGAVQRAISTVEKTSKVSELGSSIKRFASLPRFRKLNFSPLKFKLNSVLQR